MTNQIIKAMLLVNRTLVPFFAICVLFSCFVWADIESRQIPVPDGGNAEIIAYHEPLGLLLATDAVRHGIRFAQITVTPSAQVDVNWEEPIVPLTHEPTSVAAHPVLPLGFCVTVDGQTKQPGTLTVFDLRLATRGKVLMSQPVCGWPDSIAVSSDGKHLLIADEGEGDADMPGAIVYVSLAYLTTDESTWSKSLEPVMIEGLDKALKQPLSGIEPEFVCFDPAGRLAAVSCQENDAVVLIRLDESTPRIAGVVTLPEGSEPDGVALLNDVVFPGGQTGYLLAAAEEGRKVNGIRRGQSAGFYRVDSNEPSAGELISRVSLPNVLHLSEGKRCDPEGVFLKRHQNRLWAFVAAERLDQAAVLDLSSPAAPRLVGTIKTGSRPEGILAIDIAGQTILLTADEASESAGGITLAVLPSGLF